MMENITDTRPSPIAGQWYPGNKDRLNSSVAGYMQVATTPDLDGEVVALIAPHAGHIYSGPVAGHAFAVVRGLSPDLVAVISPLHQPYHQALLTSGHDAYHTPLGDIPIDKQVVQALSEQLENDIGFGLEAIRNDGEHSLEIELPFLQVALSGEFSLLPVMLRDQTSRLARALGKALAGVLRDRSALMVASTDLSHFYSQKKANALDGEILKRVEAFDPDGILQAESEGKGYACGRGAMAAVLWAARDLGADSVKVLNYATSGDITGDYSRVVGYGAAVITRSTL
jgi:AmmeMemoRadiSam system protein B